MRELGSVQRILPRVGGSEFGSALTGNFTVDIIAQDLEGEVASILGFILITHP